MARAVPKVSPANERQKICGSFAGDEVRQPPRQGNLFVRRDDDVAEMRSLLKKLMSEEWGVEAFAAELDTTASAISRAFNGKDQYEVNLTHFAPLLDHPKFAVFVTWLCLRTGHEPPKKKKAERTAEEKAEAWIRAAKKNGNAGAAVMEDAAELLGIGVEDFE